MKTTSALALLLGGCLSIPAFAQAPPPPPAGGPPPPPPGERAPGRPLPLPPGGPAGAPAPDAAATDTLTGTVKQYLLNPRGEADGLLLADNTVVKFPPHMSAALVRAVKPKDSVSVKGRRENPGMIAASAITANGQTVTDTPPADPAANPPPPPGDTTGLKPMQASGRIAAVLTAPRGEIEGAVLEDGTVLRVRPDAAAQATVLKAGATVAAKGNGTANALGKSIEVTDLGDSVSTMKPLLAAP